ncbi:HWE histidine kinase domain-containing protein [Pseudoroseomonas sp. WGS1072]|uniref:HWE histidine kinase domain-containing protein n=1 Tax=Roseomonas sp. WGS1072 TaxID=3366816 RepID=UPI003BF29280
MSLRSLLTGGFGLVGLTVALLIGLALGRSAEWRLRESILAEFAGAAGRIAELLDQGLYERRRDMVFLASLGLMRDPSAPLAARRQVLRDMQAAWPDYAILMLISTEGQVLATGSGLLEGVDVSRRAYFRQGREGPFVGDVHDARLMSPLLGRPADDPARFIDLAAPVHGPDGRLIGVVAGHLYSEWAMEVQRNVLTPLSGEHPGIHALITDESGRVVIGPPEARRRGLGEVEPEAPSRLLSARADAWLSLDGSRLIGVAPTQGHRDFLGLGWRVVVMRDAALPLSPVTALRHDALLWALLAAVGAALLGWLLSALITAPLRALSRAARRLRDDPATPLPAGGMIHEADALSEALRDLLASLRRREQELTESQARLSAVLEQMPVGVMLAQMPEGPIIFQNARATAILQRELTSIQDLQRYGAIGGLHEDGSSYEAEDYPLARAVRLGESVVRETMYYRHADGRLLTLEMSAAPVRAGSGRDMLAACTFDDVTEARAASERQRLLAAEVDHRAKNVLAVVQATLRLTQAENTDAFVRAVEGRVAAMARAQTRLADANWNGADLRALVEGEVKPFLLTRLGDGVPAFSVELVGPRVMLTPEATQPMSMVIHELAANAARYGALSVAGGALSLCWEVDEAAGLLRLRWSESNGPAVPGPPARRGFGARLITATLRDQLTGAVRWQWHASGLVCELQAPLRRVAVLAQVA